MLDVHTARLWSFSVARQSGGLAYGNSATAADVGEFYTLWSHTPLPSAIFLICIGYKIVALILPKHGKNRVSRVTGGHEGE